MLPFWHRLWYNFSPFSKFVAKKASFFYLEQTFFPLCAYAAAAVCCLSSKGCLIFLPQQHQRNVTCKTISRQSFPEKYKQKHRNCNRLCSKANFVMFCLVSQFIFGPFLCERKMKISSLRDH